jgi:dTDP-4-dehydrorhamnose reductase
MRILILGHNGYLGSYLYENIENADILQDRGVYSNGKKYDYVINCISRTNLEHCQNHYVESYISNLEPTYNALYHYPDAKLINFSSYYVYDDDGECNEDSNVTDKYHYCAHKLKSEKATISKGGLVFRLGKLFGHPDIHKQNKLTEHIILTDNLILDDVKFNPTSLNQVLKVIKYELENKSLSGLFNLSNSGSTTHYNWGVKIANHLKTVKYIDRASKIDKDFDNYGKFLMDCSKINQIIPLTHWKEDMENYLNDTVNW